MMKFKAVGLESGDLDAPDITQMESEDDERISGCCKVTLCPIRRYRVMQTERGGLRRQIDIYPEAFRMWFYFGFIIFVAIAMSVSLIFSSELDIHDNPILNRFGNNNVCIFYDLSPFSLFAIT